MTAAILGVAGQLGRALTAQMGGGAVSLSRSEVDLTVPATFERLRQIKPAVIFNCAAYNFVNRAESEPERAFAVNAYGVRELARLCADFQCLLVHFSTDYVFGLHSDRTDPYREVDAPGPVNVYGASKLCGEYFIRASCPQHLIIRTCGLYGEGNNFVRTMLRLARQDKTIRVVDDQVCTPSSAYDVASAAIGLAAERQSGLLHITNAGACTWYAFAKAVFAEAGVDVDLLPCTSAEYGSAAQRPSYSVLGTVHGRTAMGIDMRPWREALADYIRLEEK